MKKSSLFQLKIKKITTLKNFCYYEIYLLYLSKHYYCLGFYDFKNKNFFFKCHFYFIFFLKEMFFDFSYFKSKKNELKLFNFFLMLFFHFYYWFIKYNIFLIFKTDFKKYFKRLNKFYKKYFLKKCNIINSSILKKRLKYLLKND